MSYHRTKSGSIDLQATWGHGKAPRYNWAAVPAILIEDDGDGHYSAWKVEGSMRDAAITLASLTRPGCNTKVAKLSGCSLTYEDLAEDDPIQEYVKDEDGEILEVRYHLDRDPEAVAIV